MCKAGKYHECATRLGIKFKDFSSDTQECSRQKHGDRKKATGTDNFFRTIYHQVPKRFTQRRNCLHGKEWITQQISSRQGIEGQSYLFHNRNMLIMNRRINALGATKEEYFPIRMRSLPSLCKYKCGDDMATRATGYDAENWLFCHELSYKLKVFSNYFILRCKSYCLVK